MAKIPMIREASNSLYEAGRQIGHLRTERSDAALFTGVIPLDDTTPQIGEGSQIFDINYTPKRANSRINVRVSVFVAEDANTFNQFAMAAFVNNAADAVAATYEDGPSANPASFLFTRCDMTFEFSPGSTSPVNIKINGGVDNAGSWRINADENNPVFNGTMTSFVEITEIAQGVL